MEANDSIEVQCIAAPCPSVTVNPEVVSNEEVVAEKLPFIGISTNKKIVVTAFAVLFLLGLYFNKQIRAFLTA